MQANIKTVTIQEGGFIELTQNYLARLGAQIGDYLEIEEVGHRCVRLYKAKPPDEDHNNTSRS